MVPYKPPPPEKCKHETCNCDAIPLTDQEISVVERMNEMELRAIDAERVLASLFSNATGLLENWRRAAPYEFTGGEKQMLWCAETLEVLLALHRSGELPQAADAVDPHASSTGTPSTRA